MTKIKDDEEITGILSTCVVRSKVEAKGNKVYIVDLKIISTEANDAMFKLESKLKQFVGLTIAVKQLKLGDKF
jgi:hypothetical protein